ncbi:MerR family transcriptional regulator [Salinibacterium sp. G-O1]|uniref:MerR family transcriptional regulator n=1 Tax=Salinibacterium sp. G-O1 TaxID=3046208 RepID=UPI0024B93A2E|nr:MerR family transcriptional regulator [Salinibacterium sp. G-O1]MDJ0335023.1 MerR family transcriptional regulator [Salinibacterium sp. G-O1]
MNGISPGSRGLYGITVAAEMAGVGEQTLRLYERRGLLTPLRTAGGTRRYSDDDVTVLIRVVELLAEGLNLAGVGRVLALEASNRQLRAHLARLIDADREPHN